MDPQFFNSLVAACPRDGKHSGVLNDLDVTTSSKFDNAYYKNLIAQKGFLNSDQALAYENVFSRLLVQTYALSEILWFNDFVVSIIKMGNISPKGQSNGQIRKLCGYPNPPPNP